MLSEEKSAVAESLSPSLCRISASAFGSNCSQMLSVSSASKLNFFPPVWPPKVSSICQKFLSESLLPNTSTVRTSVSVCLHPAFLIVSFVMKDHWLLPSRIRCASVADLSLNVMAIAVFKRTVVSPILAPICVCFCELLRAGTVVDHSRHIYSAHAPHQEEEKKTNQNPEPPKQSSHAPSRRPLWCTVIQHADICCGMRRKTYFFLLSTFENVGKHQGTHRDTCEEICICLKPWALKIWRVLLFSQLRLHFFHAFGAICSVFVFSSKLFALCSYLILIFQYLIQTQRSVFVLA